MTNPQNRNTAETAWGYVKKGEPDECWLWTSTVTSNGYGRICFNGRKWPAHRLIYTLANGPIPDGLYVCHSCDVPLCCNPAHLWLGTIADNVHDMLKKGRASRAHVQGERSPWRRFPEKMIVGERHWRAKLTASDVAEIRRLYRELAMSEAELGRNYGVHAATIKDILAGKTWRHVGGGDIRRIVFDRRTPLERVRAALFEAGDRGLTRTELIAAIQHRVVGEALTNLLRELASEGKACSTVHKGKYRSAETWYAVA